MTWVKTYHGFTGLPIYAIWLAMHQRCYNPKNKAYKYYGARGIKICDRWNWVQNFLGDMGHPPEGMSIERIDNDGDYCPENCRWATMEEQNQNKRGVRIFVYEGEYQTISQLCKKFDLTAQLIPSAPQTL